MSWNKLGYIILKNCDVTMLKSTSPSVAADDRLASKERKRRIRFHPLPQKTTRSDPLTPHKIWTPQIAGAGVRSSMWLWLAIFCLFVANVLFMVAFLTNGWGVLMVDNPMLAHGKSVSDKEELFMQPNERYWEFGLWQCCRNDGFCLGTRWPGNLKA